MRAIFTVVVTGLMWALSAGSAWAQMPNCPVRPEPGSVVKEPATIRSRNGNLRAAFTLRNAVDPLGYMHYCYNFEGAGATEESPVLRLNPGDWLDLRLTNAITEPTKDTSMKMAGMEHTSGMTTGNPCDGGVMTDTSTNLHFHGLNIPPKCHQDEVVKTLIPAGAPPFDYHIQIPQNDPPGIYWYHPHPHGFSTVQVAGGAAGALIIEGMEKLQPEVAGLRERVIVIRQQFLNPGSWAPGPYQLSLNFQVVAPGLYPLPLIQMKPNTKEFWRVVNASTEALLGLQLQYVTTPQRLKLIALDGIPLDKPRTVTTLQLPPAGRAEFIVETPPDGTFGTLYNTGTDSGPLGDPNPAQFVANVQSTVDAEAGPMMPEVAVSPAPVVAQRFAGLATATPTGERHLHMTDHVKDADHVYVFITVDGQKEKEFEPSDPPAIVTKVGAVEDWTIQNRSPEHHVFHIHQLHFLVLEIDGKPVANSNMLDTITIPYWKGTGPYPSVKLRMDFRDPETAGTFVYHCHILDHEDAGMMAKIQVDRN